LYCGEDDVKNLQGFVTEHTAGGTQIYTNEASVCTGIDRPHEAVKQSVGEYASEQAHATAWSRFDLCSSAFVTAFTAKCRRSI